MSLRGLNYRLELLKHELYTLHEAEPSTEQYNERRSEIEYEIACLEDQIELEEKMRPLRIILMVFVFAAVIMTLFAIIFK